MCYEPETVSLENRGIVHPICIFSEGLRKIIVVMHGDWRLIKESKDKLHTDHMRRIDLIVIVFYKR